MAKLNKKLINKKVTEGLLLNVPLTIKVRLYPKKPIINKIFKRLTIEYAQACSFVSKKYFDSFCKMSYVNLHDLTYSYVRKEFNLGAQYSESTARSVIDRYKAVKTQLYNQSKRYKDVYSKHTFYINRDLSSLWTPVKFNQPVADLVSGNNWSFTHSNGKPKISISTLSVPKSKHELYVSKKKARARWLRRINKASKTKRAKLEKKGYTYRKYNNYRVKISYHIPPYFKNFLKLPHILGGAHLLNRGGAWYLYISCHFYPKNVKQFKEVVASDRGQRFIIFSYDKEHHSISVSGLKVRKKRSHFLKQRSILQNKGTRSAKRKLKNVSGREHSWVALINHKVSKALVHRYSKNTVYIFENLRGVKFEAMNAPKRDRYGRASWSFYQLGQDVTYKALLNYCSVHHVNPQYTSQRCPRCGHVLSINRNHKLHGYCCIRCGYKSNDDRIGAMNIKFLADLELDGYRRPFIRKNGAIGYHTRVHKKSKKTGKTLKAKISVIRYLSRKQALALKA